MQCDVLVLGLLDIALHNSRKGRLKGRCIGTEMNVLDNIEREDARGAVAGLGTWVLAGGEQIG